MARKVDIIGALWLAVLLAGAYGCSDGEKPASPPAGNQVSGAPIVMISLDTTRRDHLSFYGYDRETSPRLQRLAEESVVFDDFVTMSSWTLPTHASLFTGLFPMTHGAHYSNAGDVALGDADGAPGGFQAFRANRLPDDATTLAEVLQHNGYATAAIAAGPWFKPVFRLDQGFDHYDADFTSLEGRRGNEVSDLAIASLDRIGDRPFFLFLNYFDPHDPYDGHGTSWEQFLRPGADFAVSKTLAEYDAEILFMDGQIGRVLDELQARALYDRAWIVVTSDHGEHFGEHGLEIHGFSLYEDVVRGVLMIKPPRDVSLTGSRAVRAQSIDVMPTLLDALGIAPPEGIEGEPLHEISHPIVAELYRTTGNVQWKGERFRRELRAIYEDDYKLIVSTRDQDPDAGLFDLRSDPDELEDLGAQQPERAKAMRERLEAWRAARRPLATDAVEAIDPETQRQLEALGYTEQAPGGAGD
ncbi:MAG: sulfatase [Myxococcota bacterium]|jgi:arylsulfatase A-like enzyme|nr:sulfatase [Myxococcota bacterium]